MKWMEFTKVNDKPILINIAQIQMISGSSSMRTDLVLTSGYEIEVQGSYKEILQRLREMAGEIKTWVGRDGVVESVVPGW